MGASITPIKTPAETGLAALFAQVKHGLPGDATVQSARQTAFDRIHATGLPHRRVEAWKYTDLRAALREAAPIAPALSEGDAERVMSAATAFSRLDAVRLTLVNGHCVTDVAQFAALPEGVRAVSLKKGLSQGHALLAGMAMAEIVQNDVTLSLNTAFMTDGVILHIEAGTRVDLPLHLRFITDGHTPYSVATRILVVVEAGASVTLLETHEGPNGVAYHTNDVVEVIARAGAQVSHVRWNAEGSKAIALSALSAVIDSDASVTSVTLANGAVLSRHQLFLTFMGENAKATIGGATLLHGRCHADTTLMCDHAAFGGVSRELFKTVVRDEATGVFQGKIIVRQKAQKTDGHMMSAALLLSEGATMNNKPELEIFADDVQCAHGATCGELDENLLFYLMARGLPRDQAEALLVEAFLAEPLDLIAHDGAREEMTEAMKHGLLARA